VPLLNDGKEWIGDSTEIAFYLDAKYTYYDPYCLLILHRVAKAIVIEENLADKAGVHVRRLDLWGVIR
jgi:glutathione S-transferase